MKGIQYLILRFVLFLLFLFVALPFLIGLFSLLDYLEAHASITVGRWVLIPILLACVVGVPWFANQTAQHMAFEDKTLGVAIKLAYYDLRLRLAFLPLVGHWFEPPPDKKDGDEDGI